jgi:hypothetical protein
VLRLLASLLQPGGRLSLAETVVRRAQRLYDLMDLSTLDEDLRRRLVEAEEAIYGGDDPLVDWQAADLARALEAAGFREVHFEEEVQAGEALISAATLDGWFATSREGERPSYAQHLLRRLLADELARVEALFRRQLAGQAVPWQTWVAFLTGRT